MSLLLLQKKFQPRNIPDLQLWLDANRIGVQGYSLDFDGTDDFVQANNIITAYPFTMECWVRLDTNNTTYRVIALSNTTAGNIRYGVIFTNSAVLRIIAENTTPFFNDGTTSLSANVWYHVAAVFSSATDRKLYLNGVLEASGTDNVTFNNSVNNRINMGRHFTTTSFLDGKLSDVRIWNTARTAQQIVDNYQKRLIGNESGLVGYWKLDKGTGTTVEDSTTNANAGTINGAIWDNSEPLTEPIDDNTAVRVWADQSGKGYDATQSTTAARPTYRTNQLNGLPVVRFDGTDDVLTIPSSTATFKFLHSDVSTVFIVARAGSVADPNTIYGFLGTSAIGSANTGFEIFYDDRTSSSRNNGITHRIYRGIVNTFVVTQVLNNYFAANTFGMLSVVSDPANATAANRSAVRLNGGNASTTNAATDSLSTSNASFNLQLGAAGNNQGYLNGDIAEIIVYNRALNTSELAQVHRYLARKWGIALA